MNVLIDANVVLDVFQFREPHYEASALAINAALEGAVTAFFPAHAVPTVDYVLRKYADLPTAASAITWLLDTFEIVPCDATLLRLAADSEFADFEDAIVAFSAEHSHCTYIVTRNTGDFAASPIPALRPETFLEKLV